MDSKNILVIIVDMLRLTQTKILEYSDEKVVELVKEYHPHFNLDIFTELLIDYSHLIHLEVLCDVMGVVFSDMVDKAGVVQKGGEFLISECSDCSEKKLTVHSKHTADILIKHYGIHTSYRCITCTDIKRSAS